MSKPRGEKKARAMLSAINRAGLTPQFERLQGEWGVRLPGYARFTPEQKEVAQELLLFAIAYPRCFGTLVRLHREGTREMHASAGAGP